LSLVCVRVRQGARGSDLLVGGRGGAENERDGWRHGDCGERQTMIGTSDRPHRVVRLLAWRRAVREARPMMVAKSA